MEEKFNKEDESYYIHLLLELYCSFYWGNENNLEIPNCCKRGIGKPGHHCLENKCPYASFSNADNEICHTGECGEVSGEDGWIGFGGDMEPKDYDEEKTKQLLSLWETICKKKIQEAYIEFMETKKKIGE